MNKNYKFLIENIQNKESEFDNKIVEYFTYLKENKKNDFKFDYSEINLEKILIYNKLSGYFNPYESEFNRNNKLKNIIESPLVEIEIIDNDSLVFTLNKKNIIVKQLCGNIKEVKKSDYQQNFYDDEIYIPKLLKLSKSLKFKNKICIGYSTKQSDEIKKIQAWIEYSDKYNNEWVIDFVNNILINKDGYYELNNIEIINSISKEQLESEEDVYNFMKNYLELTDIEYLLFNNEFSKEIKNL